MVIATLWERFSFYGLLGLLVLFTTAPLQRGGLGWSEPDALALLGVYLGLVYATPLVGGWLADRWLGARRTILIGAALMAAGHLLMALAGLIPYLASTLLGVDLVGTLTAARLPAGALTLDAPTRAALSASGAAGPLAASYLLLTYTLALALLLVALGNGLFKPNITMLVGQLYPAGDPRRDAGYTLFFMGINAGAVLAAYGAGSLGELAGWHYGFGAAGLGMLISFAIVFSHVSKGAATDQSSRLGVGAPAGQARQQAALITVLGLFFLIYIVGYEQWSGLVTLFFRDGIDRSWGGMEVPVNWINGLNSILIIGLGPLFAAGWMALARRGRDPSPFAKFGVGLCLLAAAYASLAIGTATASTGRLALGWAVGFWVIATVGEMCVQPIGLSLVSRLAPPRHASTLMGLWFAFSALGGWLSGLLGAELLGMPPSSGFLALTAMLAAAGVMLIVLVPRLTRHANQT